MLERAVMREAFLTLAFTNNWMVVCFFFFPPFFFLHVIPVNWSIQWLGEKKKSLTIFKYQQYSKTSSYSACSGTGKLGKGNALISGRNVYTLKKMDALHTTLLACKSCYTNHATAITPLTNVIHGNTVGRSCVNKDRMDFWHANKETRHYTIIETLNHHGCLSLFHPFNTFLCRSDP